jgi:glycosyltransferase involved in cell wall biosynthesis
LDPSSNPQAPFRNPQASAVAVVCPVFNEEAVLPELISRLTRLFDSQPTFRWRAILVDDGSRDRSADIIGTAAMSDSRFECVQLSRNFGFQNALSAGVAEAANADAVVTMDADLQDPPEIIPELLRAWQNGAQVVRATRRSRAESGLRRVAFDVFHLFFNRVADHPIDPNSGTFGLLGREAIAAFNALPESNRFFPALRAWIGFSSTEVLYDRQERVGGKSQQSLSRLTRYALDGVFSSSRLPLRLLTYSGIVVALIGFAFAVFFAIRRIRGIETAQTGFTTLVTLVLFLGGVQLIGIGVLGEYLGRVYDEVKRRPNYIVKRS